MNHDQDTCTTETATAVAANAWHAQRRRAIYRKHPEVLRLLEKEPRTPYVVVAAFVVQTSVGLTLPRVVAGRRSRPWFFTLFRGLSEATGAL